MIQTRPGDLIDVTLGNEHVLFAVLTKKALFGGNWCYVFHRHPDSQFVTPPGFNAFVDFIVPKRESRITRISANNDFAKLLGPTLLKQQPTRGKIDYQIYRWSDCRVDSVAHIRTTSSPTQEELSAPEYMCLPADFACELALRQWRPSDRIWIA
jgi:hypothetical protein